jgi:D-glycero-alpha-D-manno-heptose-7-phosphate kinase
VIITQTPLRISLAGGGTDVPAHFLKHGGAVVSSAIDKFFYAVVKERFDEKIYVNYSKKEIVDSVDQLDHELVREAMRKVGVTNGIEVSFLADIPSEGSGLGSSSSVTVGTLNALYHLRGHTPSAEQLAREACDIEIQILKKPIGVQDQYIAAYGGLRFFEFRKDGSVKTDLLTPQRETLEDLDNHLMLFFTGRTRSSSAILSEQNADLDQKAAMLNQLAEQAHRVRDLILKGNIMEIGRLLHESWKVKRKLASKISDAELDAIYERALNAGAVGGKISGAGGGGFFLLFVPGDKRQSVRAALKGLREMPFRLERGGSRVILNVQKY